MASNPQPAAPMQASEGDNTLPVGTRLGEFEIVGLVGIGGFGIVYLAEDHSLGRRVALKEYMPSSLASRSQGSQVNVKAERYAETFEAGRRSFVNEARLLAQFDHPSLVKVYRFWEGNGTAYMVMPFYEGATLKQTLKSMSAPPDEAWLKRLLAPLMDALEAMHDAQVFHRDIAPDNILLLAGEKPLLLDFGAARRVIGDMTQALTVILKPGYAPVEQYAEMPEMKQGAWTDIYALAAVIYFAIMGKTPSPSVGRIMNDTMVPLAQQARGRYSEEFLSAVDRGLAVRPEARPQSIAEFRALLGVGHGHETVMRTATAFVSQPQGSQPASRTVSQAVTEPRTVAPTGGSKVPLIIGGLVAALALAGGGGYYVWKNKFAGGGGPVITDQKQPDTKPPVTKTEIPTTTTPDTRTEVRPDPVPQQQTPPPVTTTEPRAFVPMDELDRIFQQRNREHNVVVQVDQAQVRIGKDRLRFRVRSSNGGYLYLLMVGSDSKHFYLLYPNAVDSNNRLEAGKEVSLPRPGWAMVAGGPAGADQLIAVVADSPRDFSEANLSKIDPFGEFKAEDAARLLQNHAGAQSPFLGKLKCADGGSGCSNAYGAAMFTIEEIDAASAPAAQTPPPVQRPRVRPQAQAREEDPPAREQPRQQPQQRLPSNGGVPGQTLQDFVNSHRRY